MNDLRCAGNLIFFLLLITGVILPAAYADPAPNIQEPVNSPGLGNGSANPEPIPMLNAARSEILTSPSPETPHSRAVSPGMAPVDPAFLAYQNRMKQSPAKQTPAQESTIIELDNGSMSRLFLEEEIPSPVDFAYTQGLQISPDTGYVLDNSGYPGSYDLRSYGRVSSVKDQGSSGSCWAFATISSLESYLLPTEIRDFSENNMKNTHGFDVGSNDGGNRMMSTAYLTRWSGPVLESEDPYSDQSAISPAGLLPSHHVQDICFLPVRSSAIDNTNIKYALMNTGAVQASIYWDNSFYNSTNHAYFNSIISPATNHAITIVGWDDTYSSTNFTPQPAGDGAFLVKNSWGTLWGEGGYFFVSYYDRTIGDKCAFFTGEAVTNYDSIYSYDPLGWIRSYGFASTDAFYANVFTARSAETLNAIGMYETYPGSYTARIYLDPDGGPVNASGYVAETTWSDSLPGYHTIDVPDVVLKPCQKYSVVISASTPGDYYPIPVEYPESDYSGLATATAGESYVSRNGVTWTDMTTIYANTNVCLKGYTTFQTEITGIGVFRPSTHIYYRDYNGNGIWDGALSDRASSFGITGDLPLTGDWNGDGITEIGVYRPSTFMFYRDYNGNGMWDGLVTDRASLFGIAGDLPVSGDWNGDGITEIGVFRSSTHIYYRDYNGDGVWNGALIDRASSFGITGDIPISGDWTGDGITEIGVYRPSTFMFYRDYTGDGIWNGSLTDRASLFGIAGDLPVSGDWNGDGITEIGVFRSSTHIYYRDYNGDGVWNGALIDRASNFGITGDIPVSGKWS